MENNPKKNSLLDEWIDSFDVLELIHISQRKLQTLRSNGTIAFSKIGNKCYYKKKDLEHLLEQGYRRNIKHAKKGGSK